MSRLTALLKRLETTPDVVRLSSFKSEILGDCTVGDLRQSLSQEAVRDEALIDMEAACKAVCPLCASGEWPARFAVVFKNTNDAPEWHHLEIGGAIGGKDDLAHSCHAAAIRALKREPNAVAEPHEYVDAPTGAIEEHGPAPAAPNYDDGDPAKWPPSGPAAPDVAEVLSDWRVVAEFFASRNWPDTKLGDAASRLHARLPALLAKLGQGWIPMDRTAEYQEHHFKVEDVGVAWNGNRVWVCADGGALLRAKVIGEKLFVEFTPPAPGASDD